MEHPPPADDPGHAPPDDRVAAAFDALLTALRRSARGRAWLASVRVHVRRVVSATLAARATHVDEARAALLDGWRLLPPLDRATARALNGLDRSPWSPSMTVHAAHDRDPRVAAFFARRGLPRCGVCAVGADETLEEAAFGEGFDLAALLDDLNSLTQTTRG